MSSKSKITRHSISNTETPPFMFLGIVSSEPDYRLSVMLNRHLGIDLRHSPADIIEGAGSGEKRYSLFTTTPRSLSLASNRCSGKTLIRKLKSIDYLLIIHGASDRKQAEALATTVRKIGEVTAVFVLDSRETDDRNLALLSE